MRQLSDRDAWSGIPIGEVALANYQTFSILCKVTENVGLSYKVNSVLCTGVANTSR